MDARHSKLPQDLVGCHALIGELYEQLTQQQERERQSASTIAEQRSAVSAREQKLAEQRATIVEQQNTIDRLMADLALLKRSLFGRRQERFVDDDQQKLLFDATPPLEQPPAVPETDAPLVPAKPRRTSRGRGRRVFPDFLPRTQVRHELSEQEIPEELRHDPSAKRFFKKTSEQLEYEPPNLHVIEHYQEVIVRDDESGETTIATATKPASLIDSFAGPGLLAVGFKNTPNT